MSETGACLRGGAGGRHLHQPWEQPLPARSVSLAQVLLAPGLLSRGGDAIRGSISCFPLAGGLLTQGLDAPKLLPPEILAQDSP